MILNLKACTGCGLCAQLCPKNCITMAFDEQGFLTPHVEETFCIHCGLCAKKCPAGKEHSKHSVTSVYTGYYALEEVLQDSTSGGIFTALAEYVIEKKQGYVFGAQFDEDFSVFHSVAQSMEETKKFRGSKYIGSSTKNTFREAKELLEQGKWVLYTGTPCQISGFHAFLGKEYDTLITCDFVCHGVGSSAVWFRFLENMEQQHGTKIIAVKFRSKRKGYKNSQMEIVFENGNVTLSPSYQNPFGFAFASDLITRESCSNCQYCTLERVADFTVADYAGNNVSDYERKKGTSLILINSHKAGEILQQLPLILQERTLEEAINCSYHLTKKANPNPKREQFFKDFAAMDFETLQNTYLTPPASSFLTKVKEKLKAVLKR